MCHSPQRRFIECVWNIRHQTDWTGRRVYEYQNTQTEHTLLFSIHIFCSVLTFQFFYFLSSLFSPDKESRGYRRNVAAYLPKCTGSHPTRPYVILIVGAIRNSSLSHLHVKFCNLFKVSANTYTNSANIYTNSANTYTNGPDPTHNHTRKHDSISLKSLKYRSIQSARNFHNRQCLKKYLNLFPCE